MADSMNGQRLDLWCVGMAGVEMRLDLEIPVMGMPGAPKDRLGGEDGNCHHLTPLCWAVARPACFYLYLNLVPHLSARHPPLHTLSVILFFSVSFCLNLIISRPLSHPSCLYLLIPHRMHLQIMHI